VCSEAYDAPPEECFRCETSLASWWAFETAVARSRPPEPRPRRHLAVAALVGAIVASVALRVLTGTAHAPEESRPPAVAPSQEPVAPPPTSVPAPAAHTAPRVVSYRVQPGDSLWRIAAALTGDGGNWRTLWPQTDAARPLVVGTMLEVPIR
jgi:nucleoid-associated protein YgaU